jgi:hypothetical protein
MGVNTITDERSAVGQSSESVVHLSDYQRRRVFLCPGNGNELKDVALVRIADVLDEKRLSAMAAHPSSQRRTSAKPPENPTLGEELT